MKSFSNTYIFIFSAVMVILVAALLSFVALKLKPIQEKNIRVEKMQNILNSVHINSTEKNAENIYNQYVDSSRIYNFYGQPLVGKALDVNMHKEATKIDKIVSLRKQLTDTTYSPFHDFMSTMIKYQKVGKGQVNQDINDITQERKLPVYFVTKNSKVYYVIPVQGKGLWGPIWGFISVSLGQTLADITINGAVFDHKSETPGLGAEIAGDKFESSFNGKKLYRNKSDKYVSIEVVKGGTSPDNPYGVDALSGATITSKGVQAMLQDCLSDYRGFFEKELKKQSN
jgi:Na+-transporting NADH:ubiquinone oxidoreductase subunit C